MSVSFNSSMFTRARLIIFLAIGAFAFVAFTNPYFLRGDNLQNLLRSSGFFCIYALAQTFPILVRGLDLSQGGLVALTGVLAALLSQEVGVPAAILAAVSVAVLVGLIQGFLIGYWGFSAFVVTLGGGSALAGAALLISNGQTIYEVPSGYEVIGWSEPLGIPLVAWTAAFLVAISWYFLTAMRAGREIYATGSNPDAAEIIGVPTKFLTLCCYLMSAFLTAVGAVFISSRITSGSPVIGGDTAIQAIAAVVVGGVSLLGGKGSVIGVAGGAIFLATLANMLNLYNVSSYWQSVMFGLVIVFAVAFDRLRRHV